MLNDMNLPKDSREYQENLYKTGRMNLLPVLALTLLNLLMLLLGSGTYFVFSATVPYWLTAFGFVFDGQRFDTYTATGLVMAAAIMAVYLLCFLQSKKDSRWLVASAVMMVVDTLVLIALGFVTGTLITSLLDLLLHGYILYMLIRGCRAASKLKTMPLEAEIFPVEPMYPAGTMDPAYPAEYAEPMEKAAESIEEPDPVPESEF